MSKIAWKIWTCDEHKFMFYQNNYELKLNHAITNAQFASICSALTILLSEGGKHCQSFLQCLGVIWQQWAMMSNTYRDDSESLILSGYHVCLR